MKKLSFTERVMLAIAKPPINEGMIAADFKVTIGSVKRVVDWAVKYGYVEHIHVEGYEPHLGITPSGIEWLRERQPDWWKTRGGLST